MTDACAVRGRLRVATTAMPAVVDVDLDLPDGRGAGRARPVRAAASPRCCARSPGSSRPPAAGRAGDGADLAGTPTHKRGFALMFQDGQLFPHLTVARNVGYPLRLRRTARRRRPTPGSPSCSTWSGSRGTPTACRPPCPAASGSGSPWPARSPRRRGCCCSTSRSARSTPGCAQRLADDLRGILRRGRHDRADGDPRPRGGVHRRRPAGGDARRPDRAAGPDRRGLAGAGRRRDGAVPRLRPGAARATPRRGLLAAAGLPPARRRSPYAAPRWRVADGGPLRGRGASRSGRPRSRCGSSSPSTGVGEVDAVAPLDRPAGPGGRRSGCAVDAHPDWPSLPGRPRRRRPVPRLTGVYRRAQLLLVGIAVTMGAAGGAGGGRSSDKPPRRPRRLPRPVVACGCRC